MRRRTRLILTSGLAALLVLGGAVRYAALRATADSRFQGETGRRVFDPSRDASNDLKAAEQQARTQGKHILMDVGGNWCPSCLVLDGRFKADPLLRDLLAQNYILLHVNWSSENRNAQVLRPYPEPHGYPALYVLAADGRLIKAENTAELEDTIDPGKGYSRSALATFLGRYRVK